MVQILQNRDAINQILKGTANVVPDALQNYQQQRQKQQQEEKLRKQGSAVSDYLGQDVSNLPPDIQQLLVQEKLKQVSSERDYERFFPKKAQSPQAQGFDIVDTYNAYSPEKKAAFDKKFPAESASIRRQLKDRNKKNVPSNEPVPEEVVKAIGDVLEANPDATADQIAQSLDAIGVPRVYSNPYIENRRRSEERGDDKTLRIHEGWKSYDEGLRERAETGKRQIAAIRDIRKVAEKASAPWSIANWAQSFGEPGRRLSNALQTGAQGQFSAALPQLIEGFRELFGVRITDADLKILEDKLPSWTKTKEANDAIMGVLEKYARRNEKKWDIAREVKREREGYRPINYDDLVDERYNAWLSDQALIEDLPPLAEDRVWILDQNGKPLGDISKNEVAEAKKKYPNYKIVE